MRRENVFTWKHPLLELPGNKVLLLNIRSYNAHIQQLLTDNIYTDECCLLFFTETHCTNNFDRIKQFDNTWTDIHHN